MTYDRERFERQTKSLREWTSHESVATPQLATELLAWYHYIVEGLPATQQAEIMRDASSLLLELYED